MNNTFKDLEFQHKIQDYLILTSHALLKVLEPEQRSEFFTDISMGYCKHCGMNTHEYGNCHCQNDE